MATAAKATVKATANKGATSEENKEEAPNPLAGIYEGPDNFSAKFLLRLQNFITSHNDINSRLIAADGDREAAIKNFIDTSDDEKMSDLRAQLKALQDSIRDYANASVKTEDLSDDDKAKMREELKTLREKVSKGAEVARDAFEMNEIDLEGGQAAVAKMLEMMPKAKRGKAKGEKGSDLPRAYCKLKVFGGNLSADGIEFDNFSRMGTKMNIDVAELQKAFAAAGNVAWEDIKTIDRPLEFKFTPAGTETEYTVHTTPTARPGRKKASDVPAENKTEETPASDDSAKTDVSE
jgi:hypothetical protein